MRGTNVRRSHRGIAAVRGSKGSVEVRQNGLIVDQVHGAWWCPVTDQNYRTQNWVRGWIQGWNLVFRPSIWLQKGRDRLLLWSAVLTAAQGEDRGVESRSVLVLVENWCCGGVEGCCHWGRGLSWALIRETAQEYQCKTRLQCRACRVKSSDVLSVGMLKSWEFLHD